MRREDDPRVSSGPHEARFISKQIRKNPDVADIGDLEQFRAAIESQAGEDLATEHQACDRRPKLDVSGYLPGARDFPALGLAHAQKLQVLLRGAHLGLGELELIGALLGS